MMASDSSHFLDRTIALSTPGMYGIFSVIKMKQEFFLLKSDIHLMCSAQVMSVIEKHKTVVLVEFNLASGLCNADYFIRAHSRDLISYQNFFIDYRKTLFGIHSDVIEQFVGITKSLNYITSQSPLHSQLFSTTFTDPAPKYSIMIPIQKNATWWNLPMQERMVMIERHTEETLPYLSTVSRKLYHSKGLCDVDFVTFFETSDLAAFNAMMDALARIPENTYHVRYGPVIVGTIKPTEEVVNAFCNLV